MTDPGIGKLITTDRQRDAIHVAIVPIEAAHKMAPGVRVGIDKNGRANISAGNFVGVVDPFLSDSVKAGERFWLFLTPGTITSLRHVWTHPAFPTEEPAQPEGVEASVAWLREYAAKMNDYDSPEEAYQRLMEGLRTGHINSHGSNTHYSRNDIEDAEELQAHASIVLGVAIRLSGFSFSCSC